MRREIIEGPDSKGRYVYFLYWDADYHPGHLEGEYIMRERGQIFFGKLEDKKESEASRNEGIRKE